MVRIAVVEDERSAFETLSGFIARFQAEQPLQCTVTRFENAESFLAAKGGSFELVFMDIELPGMDGMEASRRFRQTDDTAVLIFVTNMARFAIKGYEVDALDFVVKPVSYYSFALKMKKALRRIGNIADRCVVLKTKEGVKRLEISAIKYIEVMGHHLFYYTADGVTDVCGSLSEAEKALRAVGFSRCNNCYLVNLDYVTEMRAGTVLVEGKELRISRSRRKEFAEDLARRIGE